MRQVQVLEKPIIICRFCGVKCDFLGHSCPERDNATVQWKYSKNNRK